jgi:hypothetical protein
MEKQMTAEATRAPVRPRKAVRGPSGQARSVEIVTAGSKQAAILAAGWAEVRMRVAKRRSAGDQMIAQSIGATRRVLIAQRYLESLTIATNASKLVFPAVRNVDHGSGVSRNCSTRKGSGK